MKKLMTVLGLGLALTLGGNVLAQGDQGFERGHGERKMQRMFSRLDLSTEQQDAIRGIREQAHDSIDAYRSGLSLERGELHQQMKALVQAETFDETAFRELMAQKAAVKSEMALIKAKSKNAIWNQLTPQQQTQMSEIMEKRSRGVKRRGHGHREFSGE
jgi:protein CpxP